MEALAAVLGGTQSLHTNAFDEAWALPSEAAARVARHTQLVLQHETDLCLTVDPLGGAYAIGALTQQVVDEARAFVHEVDAAGGMLRAIEQGWVQQRIERSSAERQVRLDQGLDRLVGVNFQPASEAEPDVDGRVVDNAEVLAAQRASLARLRSERLPAAVESALTNVEAVARSETARPGELMAACHALPV